MGAAAGRSAHLGPAPAGYRLRSLLLVQLLLLVWAPRATGTQGTEFPELCSLRKSWGQGLNLSCSGGNSGSLSCCGTRELLTLSELK